MNNGACHDCGDAKAEWKGFRPYYLELTEEERAQGIMPQSVLLCTRCRWARERERLKDHGQG